jgi:hypothetical protein
MIKGSILEKFKNFEGSTFYILKPAFFFKILNVRGSTMHLKGSTMDKKCSTMTKKCSTMD